MRSSQIGADRGLVELVRSERLGKLAGLARSSQRSLLFFLYFSPSPSLSSLFIYKNCAQGTVLTEGYFGLLTAHNDPCAYNQCAQVFRNTNTDIGGIFNTLFFSKNLGQLKLCGDLKAIFPKIIILLHAA